MIFHVLTHLKSIYLIQRFKEHEIMYRIIIASTDDSISKLTDKISDFLESQCNFARQHSFLLHELPTKSFRRTISGKVYVFTLKKGILNVSYMGDTLGSISLHQGYKNSDVSKLVQKVIKHSES